MFFEELKPDAKWNNDSHKPHIEIKRRSRFSGTACRIELKKS
jgi:hypothetical protein